MPPRITLADVARLAQTSHATASRALNARPGVRPEVREAVVRAADELGYRIDRPARHTVRGRTSSIGLAFLYPDVVVGSTLFSDLTAGVVKTMSAAGYETVLLLPPRDGHSDDLIAAIERSGVDGVILIGHMAGDRVLTWLATSGPRSVLLGRPESAPAPSYIDVDNVHAGRVALEHLLTGGRRRIGILGPLMPTSWGIDRVRGAMDASRAAGDDEGLPVAECAFNTESARAATKKLVSQHPDLDAILLCSDVWLPGCLAELHSSGLTVPDDVAIVTFDDGPVQAFSVPAITAVRQPLPLIGQELARALIDELEHGTPIRRIRIEAELVIRASSAPRRLD